MPRYSKIKLNKKNKSKNLTKRYKKNIRQTIKNQRGGFNEKIKTYFNDLDKHVNTYDIKLMLIYTYLNNPGLTEYEKTLINEYMRIPSYGKIQREYQQEILKKINRILNFSNVDGIKGVLSMDAPGRPEPREFSKWLKMKRINAQSPRNLLSDAIILSKMIDAFDINGVLLSGKNLDNLSLSFRYSFNNNGQLINNSGNSVYNTFNKTKQQLLRNNSNENPLTHFWFKFWGDHNVPDLNIYCNFIRDMYNHIMEFGGGTIIHCSAGVGRTGVVYITLNLLFEFGINPNVEFPLRIAPAGLTKDLVLQRIITCREYRMSLVQTIQQFIFILKCFGVPSPEASSNDRNITSRLNIQNPTQLPTSISQTPANKSKNRYVNILPYDNNIVNTLKTPGNPSGYINASFAPCVFPSKIPANWNCPDFILSQCPTGNTIEDFRNMIRLHKIRRIIMVTGLLEGGKVKCNDYFKLDNPNNEKPIDIDDNFKLTEQFYVEFGQIQEYIYKSLVEQLSARRLSSSNA